MRKLVSALWSTGFSLGLFYSCGWENPHTAPTWLLWWPLVVFVGSADNKGGITSLCGCLRLLHFPLPHVTPLGASQGEITALGCCVAQKGWNLWFASLLLQNFQTVICLHSGRSSLPTVWTQVKQLFISMFPCFFLEGFSCKILILWTFFKLGKQPGNTMHIVSF